MDAGKKPEVGVCDHFQPGDLAALAETWLKERSVPEPLWEGCRFGHGGGGGSGPFKSVYMEVERRNGGWVAVKLDRRKTDMAPEERGFKVVGITPAAQAAAKP